MPNNVPNAQECDATEDKKGYNAWLIKFLIANTEYLIKLYFGFIWYGNRIGYI